jgi:hypothetical protein
MDQLPDEVVSLVALHLRDVVYGDDRMPILPVLLWINRALRRTCRRALREVGYCDVLCSDLRYTLVEGFEWCVWARRGLFADRLVGRVGHCTDLWTHRPYPHTLARNQVDDFREALYLLDMGWSETKDVEDTLRFVRLAASLDAFVFANVNPMDRLLLGRTVHEHRMQRV